MVSLVLCSVDNQLAALAEVRRVLKPTGELRFYEHVVGTSWPLKAFQVAIEKTFWPHVGGNCHPARDTGQSIGQAGFEMVELRRFLWRPMPVSPKIPFILGRGRLT